MVDRSLVLAGALVAGCAMPWLPALHARDYGVMGQTFPIVETDLLATIQGKLQSMQANGGIERMQEELKAKATERVRRPQPAAGITRAVAPRQWNYDPSIVVDSDIRDHKGNLIAAAGQRVNPLDFVQFNRELVFLDGDDEAQLEWAVKRWPQGPKVKIIFVSGSPFDRMKAYQRRFYFDQKGQLTARFGIAHTPAVVRASGKVMRIEEVVVPRAAAPGGQGGQS